MLRRLAAKILQISKACPQNEKGGQIRYLCIQLIALFIFPRQNALSYVLTKKAPFLTIVDGTGSATVCP
jgi:hypothetical protein